MPFEVEILSWNSFIELHLFLPLTFFLYLDFLNESLPNTCDFGIISAVFVLKLAVSQFDDSHQRLSFYALGWVLYHHLSLEFAYLLPNPAFDNYIFQQLENEDHV